SPQVLGGDETHALRAAVSRSLAGILVTYQESDNCIPLTALYKLWGMAGGGLSETVLRPPALLCGLAALWWSPEAFGRGAEGGESLPVRVVELQRWLMALSPALVLYSRIARSYLPMVLFSFLAVAGFWRWWQEGRRKDALRYVGFGAL